MYDIDKARQERAARDRRVKLGGVVFTVKPSVRPELLIEWEEVDIDTPPRETLAVMDALIDGAIDDGEAWSALRARDDDPVSLTDMLDFIRAVVEIGSGRPTEAPSLSSPGREATEPSSTAGIPVAAAAT